MRSSEGSVTSTHSGGGSQRPELHDAQGTNLPTGEASARVRQWRIDATHSNAHSVWITLGSPDYPCKEELAAMRQRQGLELVGPQRVIQPAGGSLNLTTHLPLPSVSLQEVLPSISPICGG